MKLNIVDKLKTSIPITSERLLIKPVDKTTIEWYCKQMVLPYFSEYSLGRLDISMFDELYSAGVNYIKKLDSIPESIQNYRLVAFDKKTNTPIGGSTIFVKDCGLNLELSYWIYPEYQGLGLGTELLTSMRDTLLRIFGTSKGIQLRVRADNVKSKNLAKKVGFIESGRSLESGDRVVIRYDYKVR